MSDKTLNINIGGGNINGLQIGDNNTQTNTQHNASGPTPEAVFEKIAEAVPPEVVEDTVEPLQTFAAMPIAQLEQPETKANWSNLLERLVPYAPQIGKGLATFGAAALEALAMRNPVVAGVMALCKANAAT